MGEESVNAFLFNCLVELINCEDAETLKAELDFARFAYSCLSPRQLRERLWQWEALIALKERKRTASSKKAYAAVLAKTLSEVGERDENKRRKLLSNRPRGYIEPEELKGTHLTQIEACRLILRRRCRCRTHCHRINFARIEKEIKDQLEIFQRGSEP